MKRPLLVLTASFCIGIVFASHFRLAWLLIYSLAVFFLITGFLFSRREPVFEIILLGLAFLLGATILKSSRILPVCHIAKIISYRSRQPYLIKGFIAGTPEVKGERVIFTFSAAEIQLGNLNRSCCGKILVYARDKKGLRCGDMLLLQGKLYQPWGWGGSGWRYRDYLRRQEIWFVMNVKNSSGLVRLNARCSCFYQNFSAAIKKRLEGVIFKYLDGIPAGILDAMILGERRNIPGFVNNLMVKTGTVHILVVSGFNVGIVAFIIVLFLRLLRLPRYWRFIASLPLIITYCLVTGASNPVVRATVMAVVFIISYLIRRDPDISNAISVAALFILISNPNQLFDAGFQLSFVSVASIVFLYPKLKQLFCLGRLKLKPLRFILESCLVSLAAWMGTAGFIAYYFKIFSPVTVLANIFVVPLASLITLSGFSLIAAGLGLAPLAPLFARANEALIWIMVLINTLMLEIPGASWRLSS